MTGSKACPGRQKAKTMRRLIKTLLIRLGQGWEHRPDSDVMKPPFPYESGNAAGHTYDRLMAQHTAQS